MSMHMNHTSRRVAALGTMLTLATTLSACGSDEQAGNTPRTTPQKTASVPADQQGEDGTGTGPVREAVSDEAYLKALRAELPRPTHQITGVVDANTFTAVPLNSQGERNGAEDTYDIAWSHFDQPAGCDPAKASSNGRDEATEYLIETLQYEEIPALDDPGGWRKVVLELPEHTPEESKDGNPQRRIVVWHLDGIDPDQETNQTGWSYDAHVNAYDVFGGDVTRGLELPERILEHPELLTTPQRWMIQQNADIGTGPVEDHYVNACWEQPTYEDLKETWSFQNVNPVGRWPELFGKWSVNQTPWIKGLPEDTKHSETMTPETLESQKITNQVRRELGLVPKDF